MCGVCQWRLQAQRDCPLLHQPAATVAGPPRHQADLRLARVMSVMRGMSVMSHREQTVTCSEQYHGSIKAVRIKLICVCLIDVASKLRGTLTWFLMQD